MTKEKVYYFGSEAYYLDKENKMLYLSLSNNKKIVISFEEADELVRIYKNINRIHKLMWMIFYTDWKNNNLKNWSFEEIDNNKLFKDNLMKFEEAKSYEC